MRIAGRDRRGALGNTATERKLLVGRHFEMARVLRWTHRETGTGADMMLLLLLLTVSSASPRGEEKKELTRIGVWLCELKEGEKRVLGVGAVRQDGFLCDHYLSVNWLVRSFGAEFWGL